jgi:hypothetical protein
MNLSAKKRFRGRRYPVNLVKLSCSYDPAEIARLFGIHRNTVRHWLKESLVPIDDRRPILISGSVLRGFIMGRQQARKRKCAPASSSVSDAALLASHGAAWPTSRRTITKLPRPSLSAVFAKPRCIG